MSFYRPEKSNKSSAEKEARRSETENDELCPTIEQLEPTNDDAQSSNIKSSFRSPVQETHCPDVKYTKVSQSSQEQDSGLVILEC